MKKINIEDLSTFNLEIKEKEASDIGVNITKIRNDVVFGNENGIVLGNKNEDRAYVYHIKTTHNNKGNKTPAPFFMTSKNTWENVIEKEINNSRNICSVLKNLINEKEDCIQVEHCGTQFIVQTLEQHQHIQNKSNEKTSKILKRVYDMLAEMGEDNKIFSVEHVLNMISTTLEMSKIQTKNNLTNINENNDK
jgi:hypothetical protein